MKILIDTNVFIPLEPGAPSEMEVTTDVAAKLHSLAMELGVTVFLHPAALKDFDRDKSSERATLRRKLSRKYPFLPDPPEPSASLSAVLGSPVPLSNDWVDLRLVASLEADAVDFLVTEDQPLRRKAVRVGLGHRVLNLADAVPVLEDLLDRSPSAPPAVQSVKAYAIDATDPILDSFRQDYADFDLWLRKCKRSHRPAWIIRGVDGLLAAFSIVKDEQQPEAPTPGKTLKICSFKVSEQHNGLRFGELLLKALFDYASSNRYEWMYVTAFEKQDKLIELFRDFGFEALDQRTGQGEIILAKPLTKGPEQLGVDPLAYHVRRGPLHFVEEVDWYLIPIQPRFARVLFPESSSQGAIFPGRHAFGNSIRKAYLCQAPIASLQPGSVVVFYRSQDERSAIALGVVEATVRSSDPDVVAKHVARRTVYSLTEIRAMCRSEVLVILFRQARILEPPLSSDELMKEKVFSRPPQSVMRLKGDGLVWLRNRLRR